MIFHFTLCIYERKVYICALWIREGTYRKEYIYLNVIYFIYKFKSISEEISEEQEAKFIYIIGFGIKVFQRDTEKPTQQ